MSPLMIIGVIVFLVAAFWLIGMIQDSSAKLAAKVIVVGFAAFWVLSQFGCLSTLHQRISA